VRFFRITSDFAYLTIWFSKVKVDSLFGNYRIQSNSENTITLTLAPEALLAALRSAAAPSTSSTSGYETEEVVMKLAKKNDQAVLSFDITGLSRAGRRMRVTHDVRIEVMKPAEVQKLEEPRVPEPDVRKLHAVCTPLGCLLLIKGFI
jgi:HUS1 checkpoint protein